MGNMKGKCIAWKVLQHKEKLEKCHDKNTSANSMEDNKTRAASWNAHNALRIKTIRIQIYKNFASLMVGKNFALNHMNTLYH